MKYILPLLVILTSVIGQLQKLKLPIKVKYISLLYSFSNNIEQIEYPAPNEHIIPFCPLVR